MDELCLSKLPVSSIIKITKVGIIIKLVTKKEMEKLLSHGYLRQTHTGYVNNKGQHVGYYKTCGGKRYITDWYADKAKQLK